MLPMLGNRTSTMATRTTTIRPTTTVCEQSGDLDDEFSVEEIFIAYYDCRKHKRNTQNAIMFEQNLERNIMDLYYELNDESYTPGQSIVFVVVQPKPREVWAANFRDRVVHHVMYNRVSSIFYKQFDKYSFACIPERGSLAAVNSVEKMCRSITESWSKPAYYLKCDISNFFCSIDKAILDKTISRKIPESKTLRLIKKILWSDPTKNYFAKSNTNLLKLIPPRKSLFNSDNKHGLPVGNLSSQFFANIYLNELDRYCRIEQKCKRYARYVDDIIILDNNPSLLYKTFLSIDEWGIDNLNISFNPSKTIIQPINNGINFVGYIIKPYKKLLRRSVINRAYYKLKDYEKYDIERVKQISNSYFGMMRNGSCYENRTQYASALNQINIKVDKQLTKVKG